MTEYNVVNGTSYHVDTPKKVIDVLEKARLSRECASESMPYRLRIYLGDTKTGRDWEEIYDVTGYIGRSTGTIKIPLLVHNSRSTGGPGMLDHCIVKIRHANKRTGGVLYQHSKYHHKK